MPVDLLLGMAFRSGYEAGAEDSLGAAAPGAGVDFDRRNGPIQFRSPDRWQEGGKTGGNQCRMLLAIKRVLVEVGQECLGLLQRRVRSEGLMESLSG